MKSEKIKNMELKSSLKTLEEDLSGKTVALDAAKSDSLKLGETVEDMKRKVLLGESSIKILSEQNDKYVNELKILRIDLGQVEKNLINEKKEVILLKERFKSQKTV